MSRLTLRVSPAMHIADVAVDIGVVPVDGQRLLRRLPGPLLPVFGLHLVGPGQQGCHLFAIPGAGFGIGCLGGGVGFDHVAMHGAIDGKRLRLPVFDGNGFLPAEHADPLAVMQVIPWFIGRELFCKNVDIIAETGR